MKYSKFLLAFAGALFLTHNVYANDINTVLAKIEKIERDLSVLQRQIYRFNVSGTAPEVKEIKETASTPKAYSDYLTSRMDLIDETLTMLTNQVEEVQFKTNNITERLDRIVTDVDFRLNEIENLKPSIQQELPKSKTQATSAKKVDINNDEPEKIYNKAYDELKKGSYNKAEEYLTTFLENFAEHSLAGNAQYWLGETYYVRGDFEKSAVTFAKCYEKYGQQSKGADCLLKLGLSMASLGKNTEACVAFKNLGKEYPNSTEPIKKRNEAEIKRLNCK